MIQLKYHFGVSKTINTLCDECTKTNLWLDAATLSQSFHSKYLQTEINFKLKKLKTCIII